MGKDNQPKARQAAQLVRKGARRANHERILVVSEGLKTEPLYFNEIRAAYRLATANVQVQPSRFGTTPLQVVGYAEHLFVNGDESKRIQPRAFEQVYAVFDRDDHASYHDALDKAESLDRRYRNDLKQAVRFEAVASVPCFELWLLLHFEDVLAPLHRDEVYRRLRQSLPGYAKGETGHFAQTSPYMEIAMQRAGNLAGQASAYDGIAPYTGVHSLVKLLTTLKTV